jgi:hypothetical protein
MGQWEIAMNRIPACISAILLLILGCNAGCSASANLLTVSKEGIRGQGSISSKGEQIETIDIHPDELSPNEGQDLWIRFSSGKQVPLQSITEDLLKTIATPSSYYYSAPRNPSYYVDGYDFEFEKGHFTELLINLYGWPPRDITAFVSIGSRKGTSLTLPCSISDFENVFGKVKIGRAYYE